MNTRLLFGLLWLTPTLCFGALSTTTSYFLNVEALTNVTARSAVRADSGVFTNGLYGGTITSPLLEIGELSVSNLVAGFVFYDGTVVTNGTGVATSANLASILSNETGTGLSVFNTEPTFIGGMVITNDATTDVGITINGFSGQTNDVFRSGAGGTNYVKINGRGGLDVTKVGTPADPAIILSGRGTNYGFASQSATSLDVIVGGQTPGRFWSDNGMTLNTYLGIASATFRSEGAGNLQIETDAATPTAGVLKAADGSGSDRGGANLTIQPGASTGTGGGGSLIGRTSLTGTTSASSLNAYQDRFRYPAKFIALTDNTIASLFTVTLPATNSVGIAWTCTIMAGDATDFQSLTTSGTIDGVAKTTTITAVGTPTAAQTALAGSAGTLSVTYTFVDLGANVMALRVTADTSLTPAYLRAKLELTGINIHGAGVVINEL